MHIHMLKRRKSSAACTVIDCCICRYIIYIDIIYIYNIIYRYIDIIGGEMSLTVDNSMCVYIIRACIASSEEASSSMDDEAS